MLACKREVWHACGREVWRYEPIRFHQQRVVGEKIMAQ